MPTVPRRRKPSAPPVPVLGVGGIVMRGDRFLLIRRRHEPGAGLWSLPGGRVEAGETLRVALAREMR